MTAPLILTLKIDAQSFDYFDELRRRYFPPERNFLAAHVTLFHHLPGENGAKITKDLAEICRQTGRFPLAFTNWRFLGKGSAINIESAELLKLRAALANAWHEHLTAQDSQKFKPHITIQNKVNPETARELFENLSSDWQIKTGEAHGFTLWQYVGGPWKFEEEFLFSL